MLLTFAESGGILLTTSEAAQMISVIRSGIAAFGTEWPRFDRNYSAAVRTRSVKPFFAHGHRRTAAKSLNVFFEPVRFPHLMRLR